MLLFYLTLLLKDLQHIYIKNFIRSKTIFRHCPFSLQPIFNSSIDPYSVMSGNKLIILNLNCLKTLATEVHALEGFFQPNIFNLKKSCVGSVMA